MKKTYIIPSVEVIRVQTQQMIATSAGFGSGTKDGGAAASPEFFFDDDELSGIFAE